MRRRVACLLGCTRSPPTLLLHAIAYYPRQPEGSCKPTCLARWAWRAGGQTRDQPASLPLAPSLTLPQRCFVHSIASGPSACLTWVGCVLGRGLPDRVCRGLRHSAIGNWRQQQASSKQQASSSRRAAGQLADTLLTRWLAACACSGGACTAGGGGHSVRLARKLVHTHSDIVPLSLRIPKFPQTVCSCRCHSCTPARPPLAPPTGRVWRRP